jgi:hypothetical protein
MSEIEALIGELEEGLPTDIDGQQPHIIRRLIAALREARNDIITLNKLHETDVAIRGVQAAELARLREALEQVAQMVRSECRLVPSPCHTGVGHESELGEWLAERIEEMMK